MPQLTEDQSRVALATASALAVVTAARSNASSSAIGRMSVAQFQATWNSGAVRPAIDSILRARGFVPVIPDQLVPDGSYGGNTARAMFATFWAFDRATTRTGAQWASDMTGISTWNKLAESAAMFAPVIAGNDIRQSNGDYLVNFAAADIYRIVATTASNPPAIMPAVNTRLVQLKNALGPTSAPATVSQASSQGQQSVNQANAAPMAPSSATTDANATVATARVEGQGQVAAAQAVPPVLPATTGSSAARYEPAQAATYHGQETLYGSSVSAARKVPTVVWVAGATLVAAGLGYAVLRATEKHA